MLSLLPADSVTEHAIDTPSGKLAYTATAGTFSLFDQSGERSAAVFYTAFVAKSNDPGRPVTFVFNGGPGAGSAFLNLGLVGPRIATFGNGYDGANVRLVDNPDTWLAFTDLVLIDPVGTGWSRPAKPDGGSAFWGVHRDAESLAKVIALYVAKNGRVSSPKYILGESYGGFRAAKVARALQNNQGIVVSGIIMVSPLIEGQFQFGGDHFALGAALRVALARGGRARAQRDLQCRGAGAGRAFRADRLSRRAGRPAAARRCGACVLRARCADDRIAGRRRRPRARLHPRRLCQEFAGRRPQDRQPLRRDIRGRRSQSGIGVGARARSVSRRIHSRLRQRLRRLRARRTRFQDRDDLQPARLGHFRQMGLGRWRRPRPAERRRRFAPVAGAHAVVPADDRPRLQRSGHAIFRFALRAQPHSARTSTASAPNSGSTAAATCSTPIRNRARPSRPTHGRCMHLPDRGDAHGSKHFGWESCQKHDRNRRAWPYPTSTTHRPDTRRRSSARA